MTIKQYIVSDLERFEKASVKSFLKWYFFPGSCVFAYQVWLRIVHGLKKKQFLKYLGGVSWLILRHYEYKYGIHVDTNIHIGKGLQIAHGDGVYLNCSCIGDYFTVYQGVTLGDKGKREIPRIENNVTIYAGAVCVGDIVLHNGCTVGANAYVQQDVDENSIVAGVPAKVIKRLDEKHV